MAVPAVQLTCDPYTPPTLQYSPLHCGSQSGGDLLGAFELLKVSLLRVGRGEAACGIKKLLRVSMQIPLSGEPQLPELEEGEGDIYTVPANIRPVLSTYRLEVQIHNSNDCTL